MHINIQSQILIVKPKFSNSKYVDLHNMNLKCIIHTIRCFRFNLQFELLTV